MKTISYASAASTLRLELDATPAASKVTILDPDGGTLLAATSVTLWTATTLAGAVVAGDDHLHLTSVTGLVAGDRLWVATGTSGPGEACQVRYVDTTPKVAYLTRPTDYDHANGAAVSGLFLTYSLDASSATNYPKGRQVTALWQDQTSKTIWTQIYEVDYGTVDYGDLAEEFSRLYASVWEMARDRWDAIQTYALITVKQDVASKGRSFDRLRDEDAARPVLLSKCVQVAMLGTGDQWRDERVEALEEYSRRLDTLCASSVWWDEDQDMVHDESEDETTEPLFSRGF